MSPYFSIIVPVYNSSQYLNRCIDSILSQTYNDFELILVDDGSIDESGNICDVYAQKDKRIRVFHQPNGGVSSARNKGIKEANGEYAIFVDSDDYILKDKLETAKIYCKNYPDLITGLYLVADSDKYKQHSISIKDYEYIKNVCVVWTSIFNTKIIKKHSILFNENTCHGEDVLFVLNYFYYCRTILFVNEFGYNYNNQHGMGLNSRFQSWKTELYTLRKIRDTRQKIINKLLKTNNKTEKFRFIEALRIIKSLYIHPKTNNIKKTDIIKDILTDTDFINYTNSPCLSDYIIYKLAKYRMYRMLSIFLCIWKLKNKQSFLK